MNLSVTLRVQWRFHQSWHFLPSAMPPHPQLCWGKVSPSQRILPHTMQKCVLTWRTSPMPASHSLSAMPSPNICSAAPLLSFVLKPWNLSCQTFESTWWGKGMGGGGRGESFTTIGISFPVQCPPQCTTRPLFCSDLQSSLGPIGTAMEVNHNISM